MLRYASSFCVLAEELHFGRAAARLHITQPALSHQIKMLELDMGCVLVARSPQRVCLTEAGLGFAQELGAALGQMERAKQTALQVARGTAGALSIAYCELPWSGGLASIIQRYVIRYPEVEITLRALATNEQADGIANGTIDIGFLHPPLASSALVLWSAKDERLMAAMSQSHALADVPRLRLADLAPHRMIFCSAGSAPRLHAAVLEACGAAGFRPRQRVSDDSWHAMGTEALAGLGVALVPETLAESFSQHLVFKPIEDFDWRLQTALATRQGGLRPAALRFIELAKE